MNFELYTHKTNVQAYITHIEEKKPILQLISLKLYCRRFLLNAINLPVMYDPEQHLKDLL